MISGALNRPKKANLDPPPPKVKQQRQQQQQHTSVSYTWLGCFIIIIVHLTFISLLSRPHLFIAL